MRGHGIPTLHRFRSPYAFRGLVVDNHKLSNSLLRLTAGQQSINTLELSLLRNFRKYAHAQPAPGIDSIWHWLALGQHHGLPTRLIDWTYSPFVALHFATEYPEEYDARRHRLVRELRRGEQAAAAASEGDPRGGAVADLHDRHAGPVPVAARRSTRSRAIRSCVFIEPPSLDTRILNQFALFSLMPDAVGAARHMARGSSSALCRRVDRPC